MERSILRKALFLGPPRIVSPNLTSTRLGVCLTPLSCGLYNDFPEIQRTCGAMNVLFFEVTLLFYFLGTTLFLVQLAGRSEGIWKPSFVVAGIGFFFHTLALVSRMVDGVHIHLTAMSEALSFFSWAL